MGRLKDDLLNRAEEFADRVLDVTEVLSNQGRSVRIIDQLTGSGTSVGANAFEADEAMSRPDFCKCLGVALKELGETRFWLRLVARRKWIRATRLAALQAEAIELKRIFGAIIHRSREAKARRRAL